MLTSLVTIRTDVFKRRFRTFTWKSSNILSNTLTKTSWVIKTNFHMYRFIQFMQLKQLLGYASIDEQRLLFDAPGVLEDTLFIEALRAWITEVPQEILWQRLQWLQRLEERTIWSNRLYDTWKGTLYYEILETRRHIRKVKKYSGYVRNASSVGSKKFRGSAPVPESLEWNNDVNIDYYMFLTVGELSTGQPGRFFFTPMRAQKAETVPRLIIC